MDEQPRTATDLSTEELLAALHVRGHIQRVRAEANPMPFLRPALQKAQRAHLGDDLADVYQALLELAVATEDTLTRLLVSHPDLKPRTE